MFEKLKNWKVALALTVIIAVANLPLQYLAYRFFYVEPYIASLPVALRPIANYEPFFRTWYGASTIIVWTALILLWFGHLGFKYKMAVRSSPKITQTLVAVLLCLLLFLCIFQVKVSYCEWNVSRNVDVLMIGDEEFRSDPNRMTNAETVLQDVSDNRFDQSLINFYARGWLEWDSADGVTFSYDLMQEALADSGLPREQVEIVPGFWDWGFVSGSEWTDSDGLKWWIDLLLIFSGQNMDTRGLSPPMCNMTIIRHDSVDRHVLTHELGHQYYLTHCSYAWCAMNVDWQFGDQFCGGCRSKLTSNNGKWLTDPEAFVGCFDDQGEIVKPGHGFFDYGMLWWFSRVKYGATLTIRAEAKEGWFFDHYYGINAPFIFTQDPRDPPPPSFIKYEQEFDFTFNDTWTITAWFTPARYLTVSTVGRGTTTPSSGDWYQENTTATVTANPDTGYEFKYWKLDEVQNTSNPINVYMNTDHSLQAYFTQDYRLRIWIDNGNGTTSPAPGEYWYYEGTQVSITATPLDGYHFSYWNIDGQTQELRTETVTMNQNHDAYVVFNPCLVLFPVYNGDGEWMAGCCTIHYRRSGQILINGTCHGNYPWQYDFGRIDWDARENGGVLPLPGAELEHYNYYVRTLGGAYDFVIECPGYQTQYYFGVQIPSVDWGDLIGFWTVILREGSTSSSGCSFSARICVC